MPAPSNITPDTAFQVTQLDFTQTLDVTDAPTGTGYASTCDSTQYRAVWYSYTAGATDEYVAINAAPSGTASYIPRISLWTGTPLAQFSLSTPTQHFCKILGANVWISVPMTANTTYYIQITDSAAGVHDATLLIQMQAAPSATAPVGSLIITDDSLAFQAAVLSATDGTILTYLDMPAGEFAAIVPTGEACLSSDEDGNGVTFFDDTLTAVSTWTAPASSLVFAITTNHSDRFYVLTLASLTTATLRAFSLTGTLLQTWTLPASANGSGNLAVARDNSVAYYSPGGASSVIYAYDLVNSTALPDLHAAFGTEYVVGAGTGEVLADGTILFTYGSTANGATPKLRLFDSSGTVLNTFALDDATFLFLNRWCLASETTIWAWGHTVAATSPALFHLVSLVDGTTSTSLSVPETRDSGESATGYPFSISNSCPVFVTTVSLTPVAPTVPIYHTVQLGDGSAVLQERRLRRSPHAVAELDRLFISKFQLHLQTAIGNSDTPNPIVTFRCSKDGGRTWSNPRLMQAGKVGEFTKRLIAWRLGQGRDWVFEISTVDQNAPWAIVDAYIQAERGTS